MQASPDIDTAPHGKLVSPSPSFGAGAWPPDELNPWELMHPVAYWPAAGGWVIFDRHLPDGTRQHIVATRPQLDALDRSFKPDESTAAMLCNAQVFWLR